MIEQPTVVIAYTKESSADECIRGLAEQLKEYPRVGGGYVLPGATCTLGFRFVTISDVYDFPAAAAVVLDALGSIQARVDLVQVEGECHSVLCTLRDMAEEAAIPFEDLCYRFYSSGELSEHRLDPVAIDAETQGLDTPLGNGTEPHLVFRNPSDEDPITGRGEPTYNSTTMLNWLAAEGLYSSPHLELINQATAVGALVGLVNTTVCRTGENAEVILSMLELTEVQPLW